MYKSRAPVNRAQTSPQTHGSVRCRHVDGPTFTTRYPLRLRRRSAAHAPENGRHGGVLPRNGCVTRGIQGCRPLSHADGSTKPGGWYDGGKRGSDGMERRRVDTAGYGAVSGDDRRGSSSEWGCTPNPRVYAHVGRFMPDRHQCRNNIGAEDRVAGNGCATRWHVSCSFRCGGAWARSCQTPTATRYTSTIRCTHVPKESNGPPAARHNGGRGR